jgi:hypothetical protein
MHEEHTLTCFSQSTPCHPVCLPLLPALVTATSTAVQYAYSTCREPCGLAICRASWEPCLPESSLPLFHQRGFLLSFKVRPSDSQRPGSPFSPHTEEHVGSLAGETPTIPRGRPETKQPGHSALMGSVPDGGHSHSCRRPKRLKG